MPFWLHDCSFIYKARNNSRYRRLTITILILGLIIFVWYAVFYHNSFHRYRREQREYQKTNRDIQKLHHVLLHYKKIEHDYRCCEEDFVLATKDSYREHDVIAYLINSMKQHKIQCISLIPTKKEIDDLFNQSYFTLIARARFDKIVPFFKEMSTADYLIEFHDVVMIRSENNELELKAEVGVSTVIPS